MNTTKQHECNYANILVMAMQPKQPERARGNHGTSGMFDVRFVGVPETPIFQLCFKPPRMRSSRGLILLPIPKR